MLPVLPRGSARALRHICPLRATRAAICRRRPTRDGSGPFFQQADGKLTHDAGVIRRTRDLSNAASTLFVESLQARTSITHG